MKTRKEAINPIEGWNGASGSTALFKAAMYAGCIRRHPAVPRVFCLSGHGEESLRTTDGAGAVGVASPGKIRAARE